MPQNIRSDLATATTLYYPLVGMGNFIDLPSLAERLKTTVAYLDDQITQAKISCSDLIVLENISVGSPEDQNRAVLQLSNDQSSGLVFCGLFGSMSEDREEVVQFAEDLAKTEALKGRMIAIGEHRGSGPRCYS